MDKFRWSALPLVFFLALWYLVPRWIKSLPSKTAASPAKDIADLTAAHKVEVQVSEDIRDLLAAHKVEARVYGDGIQFVKVRIRKTTSGSIGVSLAAGLYFVSGKPSAQNMVATASRNVTLNGSEFVEVTVPAACASRAREIPDVNDSFTIGRAPERELSTVMRKLEQEGASYPVIQAVTWILTDNAAYGDMAILKTVDRVSGAAP